MHGPKHQTSATIAFAVGAAGIAFYSMMDAVMKGMTLAMGVYNAMLWRMAALLVLSGLVYLLSRPRRPSLAAMRVHAIRGAVSAVMALLFFWGLARIPMAQAIALAYVAPLLSLFLAAVLLEERIGRTTILASLVACAGVGIIVIGQARAELGEQALLGTLATLASALCYAWNIILMRQQALLAGPVEVTFFQAVFTGAALLLGAPWLADLPPAGQLGPIALSAIFSMLALVLLSWAYARAEASYLAPTEYTSFVWASLFGWLLFAEVPRLYTLAGAALIVSGCIWAARCRPAPDVEAGMP